MKFQFHNNDFLNSFIRYYEDSKFIYTHYNSIIILDDKTILINDIEVFKALASRKYKHCLPIFGDYKEEVA